MHWVRQDVRAALRGFLRAPGFLLAAVITLALGIGANTAIFSVVYAVLLKPPAYSQPERLVAINSSAGDSNHKYSNRMADYLDWRARVKALKDSALFRRGEIQSLTGAGSAEPESVRVCSITPNLFGVLGVQPALGRSFQDDEAQAGRNLVVILSHAFWKNRMGGRKEVVGEKIQLNAQAFEVVGVMPAGFDVPDLQTEIWVPLVVSPAEVRARIMHRYLGYGRLADGVSIDAARAEMASLASVLAREYPRNNLKTRFFLTPLQEDRAGQVQAPLLALLGAVVLVVLIACANVANLLLVRATGRRQEMAVRTALGASQFRLTRQLLVESLILSVAGCAAGIAVAGAALRSMVSLIPSQVPGLEHATLNLYVLLFALGLSLLTGLVFGAVPAWMSSRAEAAESLRQRSGSSGSSWGRRARAGLAVIEVALCVMLLLGAGLLLRSFDSLLRVDPGIRPEGVFSMRVSLPTNRYPDNQSWRTFQGKFLQQAGALPGLASAGIVSKLPFDGSLQTAPITVEGKPQEQQSIEQVDLRNASPGYFPTMGIQLRKGRLFSDSDHADAPRVMVIDDLIATRYFGTEDPVGRRLKVGSVFSTEPWHTVVGVVNTVRGDGVDKPNRGQVYVHYAQTTLDRFAIVGRAAAPGVDIGAAMRALIHNIDSDQSVFQLDWMQSVMDRAVGPRRFPLILLSTLAGIALILAGVGIYSVISYGVSQRTQEIGVRMALGAGSGPVLRMVLREAGRLALIGTLVGLAGGAMLSSAIRSLLFNVSVFDPLAFLSAGIVVVVATLSAALVPARRAASLDPLTAIRYE